MKNTYKYKVETLHDPEMHEKIQEDYFVGLSTLKLESRLYVTANFLQDINVDKLSMVYLAANVINSEKVIIVSNFLPIQLGYTNKNIFLRSRRIDHHNCLYIRYSTLEKAGFRDRFYCIDVRKKYILISEA